MLAQKRYLIHGLKEQLPTILSKYKLDQIYNADKFGLFYQTQAVENTASLG